MFGFDSSVKDAIELVPTIENDYRVSHPIVRDISSCFVLGVSLALLGQ